MPEIRRTTPVPPAGPRPTPRPTPLAARAVTTPTILAADLHVKLQDADGFSQRSATDVTGQVAGTLRVAPGYVLKRLQDAIKSDASKTIDSIRWDAQAGAYVVKGHAKLAWLPDPGFTITLKPTGDGRLAVEAHSWADWLARLFGRQDTAGVLRGQLAKFQGQLAVKEEDGRFVLDLLPGMSIPFGAMGGQVVITDVVRQPGDASLGFDAQGGLVFKIKRAQIAGGTQLGVATKADATPDQAELDVTLALHEDHQVEATLRGSAQAQLDADELAALVGSRKDVLGPIGKQASVSVGDLRIVGAFADKTAWQTTASGHVEIETESGLAIAGPLTAVVDGAKKTTRVDAQDLTVAHAGVARVVLPGVHTEKTPDGFSLHLDPAPEAPYAPRAATSGNRLGLVIGGAAFNRTLTDVITRATTSVHGETFEFSPGVETKKLITLMAEQAAGIRIVDGQARLVDDGVAIRVLTDRDAEAARSWAGRSADALTGKAGEPWAAALRQAIQAGTGAYAGLSADERARAIANLEAHLEIRDNAHPVLRTDHRKVWVVDGAFGMTGGMNLDDPMLTTLHDVMIPTVGPAVQDLAAEWGENWREVGGTAPDATPAAAADAARFQDLVGAPASTVQVLVTDDRQNEIEEALVRAIDGAQTRIRLEHAYFTEDRVLERLEAALRRGVDLDVTTPEIPGGVFYAGNRAKLAKLLAAAQAPGAGKLTINFFQQGGDYGFHNHTKALAVDGQALIVGSGNLDQRGLAGSFAANGDRILFNRELDYRITDPAFVARFEREVFDADHAAGEGKSLAQKTAETWAFDAVGEDWEALANRFGGKPVADAIAPLNAELVQGATAALAAARRRAGVAGSDTSLLLDLGAKLGALQKGQAALEADLRQLPAAQQGARIQRDAQAIAATLPTGRVRDMATKAMANAQAAYLKALAETPAPGYPTWFADRLAATMVRWGARAATLPARDRLAGLIAGAAPGTFDAEYAKVLTPDATAARHSEVMDFLF